MVREWFGRSRTDDGSKPREDQPDATTADDATDLGDELTVAAEATVEDASPPSVPSTDDAAGDIGSGPTTDPTPEPVGGEPATDTDAAEPLTDTDVPAPVVDEDVAAGPIARPAPAVTSDALFVVGRAHRPFEPAAVDAEFRDLPYRPDTVTDGWSIPNPKAPHLTVRAASVRGYGHRRTGEPRQDDVAVLWSGTRVVAAVADGVSACKHAHLGATVAVRYATRWLREKAPENIAAADWRDLAKEAAWAVVEQAAAVTGREPDPQEAERLMATTLVAAAIDAPSEPGGPARAQLLGIGDSGVWLASPEALVKVEGGKDLDAAISSSAVVGLPRVPELLAPITVEIPVGSALVIATDGFGDPLGDASGSLGNLYRTRLFPPPPPLEFAHMLDFVRATFEDDRAMVAIWPQTADSSGVNG